ncbi:type III polyketide synthase [Minwuia thermotolerans]|uniref:Chalcone synthase n=1 Tax=Minwuia thermotolerans TaxID=2056226 RepID=A0A2M9FW99_9PROT|nr:3-oxoacyl-[acyl-carrier-protein] synthase III C-terminal domain-containing protein [Minwuia thermotolerans]PJK27732.1 chalcone synthase [Minwuia thermotolerans]
MTDTNRPVAHMAGLTVANPDHVLEQAEVARRAGELFGGALASFDRLRPVYENAAIDTRYSCVPIDWYQEAHGFGARNDLYIRNAVDLLEKAARGALEKAEMTADQIDGVVAVSTSGIATPSLDALLMERMNLRRDMQRLPVFGLGCAGGVLGLARAAQMAMSQPGKTYLLLVVELCGLTFRSRDYSKSNVIATALFGDGAAAALVGTHLTSGAAVHSFAEHTWRDTLDVMGWDVTDDGLSVIFSRDIPTHVRARMGAALGSYLAREGLNLDDFRHFLSHPGGAKVLDALEEIFGLAPGGMAHSRRVLAQFGNMSAATVLFVVRAAMDDGLHGRALLSTLGPGFTAGFLTLDLP